MYILAISHQSDICCHNSVHCRQVEEPTCSFIQSKHELKQRLDLAKKHETHQQQIDTNNTQQGKANKRA